ncbi:hypothetical protein Tco_0880922, partial [Tanacetum coccineum]
MVSDYHGTPSAIVSIEIHVSLLFWKGCTESLGNQAQVQYSFSSGDRRTVGAYDSNIRGYVTFMHRRAVEFQPVNSFSLESITYTGVRRLVSYRIGVTSSASHVHNGFMYHYSELMDHPLHVSLIPFRSDPCGIYLTGRALKSILDRQDRVMRNKTIPFVKILWRNHPEREATWETEESIRNFLSIFSILHDLEREFHMRLLRWRIEQSVLDTFKVSLTPRNKLNVMDLFKLDSPNDNIIMSDSEHSTVTYTSVPFLVEDDSYIGSPGIDGPPIMPEDPYAYIMAAYEVPPSPDYIPGPEVPPSPDYILGPEEPQSPPLLDFVPEPMYLEYMPQEIHQLLPYPLQIHQDMDDDDDEDEDEDEEEEEEEKHPVPVDFVPPVHRMTARISIRDEPSISLPPR